MVIARINHKGHFPFIFRLTCTVFLTLIHYLVAFILDFSRFKHFEYESLPISSSFMVEAIYL